MRQTKEMLQSLRDKLRKREGHFVTECSRWRQGAEETALLCKLEMLEFHEETTRLDKTSEAVRPIFAGIVKNTQCDNHGVL